MLRPSTKDATLERFCELARVKAVEVTGIADLRFKGPDKHGVWHFPCPVNGPGHTWTGNDPQAWVTIVGGEIKCGCRKCTPKPANGSDPDYEGSLAAYSEAVKDAIEWDDAANVEHANFGWEEIRHHDYVTSDGAFLLRHRKIKKRHGNSEPQWAFQVKANEPDNLLVTWKACRPTEWLASVYPGLYQHYYNAVHVYRHEAFKACPTYRPVVCEGEKDAETLARLLTAAGVPDLIPTALPDQQPTVLAPHQLDVFRSREVTFFPDNDEGGRKFAEKWSALLWGVAGQQKLFDATLFGTRVITHGTKKGEEKGRDLTEWVEANGERTDAELGRELLAALTSTQVLMEPLARPDAWRQKLSKGAKGGVRDSAANAAIVVVQHPEVAGRVRRNTRSGEVEIVDPPWGPGVVAGARSIANQLSIWLEQTDRDRLHLSERSFNDALHAVPPPYDPLSPLLAVAWDNTPRLDVLFERYLPLEMGTNLALALSRVFMGDLVRKLRGDLAAQRLLVAIETDLPLDVADAMVGQHALQHRGRINERLVEHFVRTEACLIQTSMDVCANRQAALSSLPLIFARSVWHVPSRSYVGSPLFLAVGSEPGDDRTEAKIDDRVFDYRLDGEPQLEALAFDFPQMIAEAAVRIEELSALQLPVKAKATTAATKRRLEDLRFIGGCLLLYVTKEVEGVDVSNQRALANARDRAEPLRHVVRDQFIDALHSHLRQMYRDRGQMERAFNAFCQAMGWRAWTVINKSAATFAKVDMDGKEQRTFPGTLLTPERLTALKEFLGPSGPSATPPKGGGAAEPPDGPEGADSFCLLNSFCTEPQKEESKETAEDSSIEGSFLTFVEAYTHKRNDSIRRIESIPYAHASCVNTKQKGGLPYLEGEAAIARVREILSEQGTCAIDFETFPTDPAWHAEQAAKSAPHGTMGKARADALLFARLNGRAHVRKACTLQLHHSVGGEVFARLMDPVCDQLQRMFQPITDAPPWEDAVTLVAHNAQFEVEVLLNHGVAVDVECTLLAAKCLYIEAVADDSPQPVKFSLAALVERDLGRARDKTIRDRDWSLEESLDAEAVEYGLQDARDALELWRKYEALLRADGLLQGYRNMQGALLPTAAANLAGLPLDKAAHHVLMHKLERDASGLKRDLDTACDRRIDNHGSTPQVSMWITEQVVGSPIKRPVPPNIMSLTEFVVAKGGLKAASRGELESRGLHHVTFKRKRLVKDRGGRSLHDAAVAAQEAGYFAEYDPTVYTTEDMLLEALAQEAAGKPMIPLERMREWADYQVTLEDYQARTEDLNPQELQFAFLARLQERTGKAVMSWRRTENGHLAITKGSKLRKAEQLQDYFPEIAAYLVKHAQWARATKLLDSFGETLERWVDDDGYARGQARVFAAWTGRQSCVDPNLQNQPREEVFRALWTAKPGRKLVIADYSQIELRLAGIESGDERLLEVYRQGRDVHAETASVILLKPLEEVTKVDRQPAKGVNFLAIYGGGAAKLAETIGCELEHAHVILARFFTAYPGLSKYREEAPRAAIAHGSIDIRPGRRVKYRDGASSPTQAINAPIQGGAASVQMRAIRLVYDALRERPQLDVRLAASVHDEIILDSSEVDADAAAVILIDGMTKALLEIYPEAEVMGLAQLAAAKACDRWSEKA